MLNYYVYDDDNEIDVYFVNPNDGFDYGHFMLSKASVKPEIVDEVIKVDYKLFESKMSSVGRSKSLTRDYNSLGKSIDVYTLEKMISKYDFSGRNMSFEEYMDKDLKYYTKYDDPHFNFLLIECQRPSDKELKAVEDFREKLIEKAELLKKDILRKYSY